MKSFTYPAVVFNDPESGGAVIAIYDLSLITEGASVEEAHKNMRDLLGAHMSYALKNELLFNDPTPYIQIVKDFPNNQCVLVEVKLDDRNNVIK